MLLFPEKRNLLAYKEEAEEAEGAEEVEGVEEDIIDSTCADGGRRGWSRKREKTRE